MSSLSCVTSKTNKQSFGQKIALFFPGLNYKTTKLVTRRIYTSSPFVVSIKGSAQRLEELSVLVTVRELIIRLLAKMLTAASH